MSSIKNVIGLRDEEKKEKNKLEIIFWKKIVCHFTPVLSEKTICPFAEEDVSPNFCF